MAHDERGPPFDERPRGEVVKFSDRRADKAEAAAFEGRAAYTRAPLDWENLEELGPPPKRTWAIDHWLGMGHVTLLSGTGGVGKSVLAQQISTALAFGQEFVAPVPQRRTVLMWAGEDDSEELWRRQTAISKHFETPLSDLRGRLYVEPMEGIECSLFDYAAGQLVRTSMLTELREQVGDYKADFVVLDNIARLFGGNENDRHHVTSFFSALQWAAKPTGAGVLLLGHVSRMLKSEFSGSSAWENSARARLWFSDTPPDMIDERKDDAEEDDKTDLRFLSKRKANYSAKDVCVLRYVDGAYVIEKPPAGGGSIVNAIDAKRARGVVIAAAQELTRMNVSFSDAARSPTNYLPSLILKFKLNEGFGRKDLGRAMCDLMLDNLLRREIVGQYPNRTPKHGLVLHLTPDAPK